MNRVNTHLLVAVAGATLLLSGCATQSNRAIETPMVESHNSDYQGEKKPIVVTGFENKSDYFNI